jgi:YHS domain-containing protein/putative intracellular protease/amidase
MKRRELLKKSAAFGFMAAMPFSLSVTPQAEAESSTGAVKPSALAGPLKPPADGVPVACLISDGAVVIDFCGPSEVFGNVMPGGRMDMNAFRVYTVAETAKPVTAAGGMRFVPDYTLENASAPKVIVIPAQNDSSEAMLEWIRKSAKTADVTMSVCTGAFLLAKTGLLAGKAATTHHSAYVELSMKFPDIQVKRGVRFVEQGNLATAGGLCCGIDLALRVVERYYGRETARAAAYNMEYQGQGWLDPNLNSAYAKMRTSLNGHPLCPVCSMDLDIATAPRSIYKGKTYYFCSQDHKVLFDSAPERVLAVLQI